MVGDNDLERVWNKAAVSYQGSVSVLPGETKDIIKYLG
jgi:hypothetical protein